MRSATILLCAVVCLFIVSANSVAAETTQATNGDSNQPVSNSAITTDDHVDESSSGDEAAPSGEADSSAAEDMGDPTPEDLAAGIQIATIIPDTTQPTAK